jgi:hypothetical protein
MKPLITSIILLIPFFLTAQEINNPYTLDEFLEALQNDNYSSEYKNMIFTYEEIPELLENSDNTNIIQNFPRNPLSSFYQTHVEAGAVCLWIIEGIRKNDGEFNLANFNEYPSLNPLLESDGSISTDNLNEEEILLEAVKCYERWWNDNSIDLSDKLKINPLKNSGIEFH